MTHDPRKERLKDVAQLRLYVRRHGEVPPSGKLAEYIGQTRQRIARRWGHWARLYEVAGYERPEGRGRWRRGRNLTEEHKRRISEAIQARWDERKRKETEA